MKSLYREFKKSNELNTEVVTAEVIDVLRKHNVTRMEMKAVFNEVESLLDAFASI